VTTLVPENIRDIVAGQSLETMVYAARETPDGSLSSELWPDWRNRLDLYDAILIGPGMTRHNDTLLLVREFLRESTKPIVVDADAIAVLAHQPDWLTKANCPVIITPHPGELAMLFGPHVSEVQENREGMALAAAKYTNATVVLKGAGTIIAQTEHPCIVNLTGNPGMATGGMGDVLGGLIVGLVAQGLTPYDASRAGVYIHGRAGDQVAMRASQAGLSATDLIEEIPFVFRDLSLR
jgi:NAD(P)H-hydrate epimerase